MVVSNDAKNEVRDYLQSNVSEVRFGTDGTAPSEGDSTLGNNVSGTEDTSPSITVGNKTLNITGILKSTTGAGTTYNEAGVFLSSGNLFDRVVYPNYDHNDSQEFHITFIGRID